MANLSDGSTAAKVQGVLGKLYFDAGRPELAEEILPKSSFIGTGKSGYYE